MTRQRISAAAAVVCVCCAVSLRAQSGTASDANSAGSASVVPRLIKFSGEINPQITQNRNNQNGTSQSTTPVSVTLSLYELQEGSSPLWSESQKVQVDQQGRYTVLLGATQPDGLPLDLFTSGKALWLGVQPQLPGAVEQPRVLLVAVPYALKAADADTLGGLPASAFLAAAASQVGGASSQSGSAGLVNGQRTTDNGPLTSGPQLGAPCPSITSDGLATATSIALFTTNCNLEASAITQTSGNIGISGASPSNTKFQITDTPAADFGTHYTNHELLNSSVTKNGTNKGLTFVMDATNMAISKGVTDSGYRIGVEGAAYANTAGFAGTLASQYGVWGRAGINAATSGATVSNAYAGYFDIFNGVAGTKITNAYGVYINNSATTGTISNRYDLYASSPNANNYFAGKLGIGTKTPAATLEVNGTARFDGAVTFAGGGVETLTGDLSLPQTAGAGVGVIDLGGSPFIHACCPESTQNTFVGTGAGNFTADATSTASGIGQNTSMGYKALQGLTSGYDNTASGVQALLGNSTGYDNTASGVSSLYSNSSGIYNTASGVDALYTNSTGSYNTASGVNALYSNTTGNYNAAYGVNALDSNTTGYYNTANGVDALYTNSTGYNNTASGIFALFTNGAGYDNTASGFNALYSNDTGNYNTAMGDNALYTNTTGGQNTAIGDFALDLNTTGNFNTAIGDTALFANTRGTMNTAVGRYAGFCRSCTAYTPATGAYSTFIGAYASTTVDGLTSATAIGYGAEVDESNALVLGASGTRVGIYTSTPSNIFTIGQGAGHAIADAWDTYSSRRWKSDIQPLQGALGKVELLRGVSYTYTANGKHDIGMIAEEVGRVVPEVVSYEENGKDARGIDYARLTALLVEAVKQQQSEIQQEKSQIRRLEAKVRRLEAKGGAAVRPPAKPTITAITKAGK